MPLWFRKERQLSSHRTISYSGEPDAVKVSRPVRRRGRAARPFPILAGGCQVYRVPLAILATGTGILAALSFCIGVILETIAQYHNENFALLRRLLQRCPWARGPRARAA